MATSTNAPALSTFVFEKSYQIRIISQNDEPWFIATDVCNALGIRNVTQALEKLDEDERSILNIGLNDERSNFKLGLELTSAFDNRIKEINIISESGLYFLVLRSRNATKKGSIPHRFRKWVTSEVLPSIRKTGSYVQTITPAQQREIQKIISKRAYSVGKEFPKAFKALYRALKNKYRIAEYKQLPCAAFEEAMQFLGTYNIELPDNEGKLRQVAILTEEEGYWIYEIFSMLKVYKDRVMPLCEALNTLGVKQADVLHGALTHPSNLADKYLKNALNRCLPLRDSFLENFSTKVTYL